MITPPAPARALMPAGLRHVAARFPLPAACALGATVLALVTGTHVPFEVSDEVSRTLGLLLLALFAAVAARLWGERTGASPVLQAALAGGLVAALAARVYTLPIENSLTALMLAPGVITLASTLPFAGRGDGGAFWSFNQAAWIGSLIAFVVALTLGLGMTLAFGAMDELLGLDVPSELYGHTWTICLTLVWPLVALGLAPPLAGQGARDPGRLVTLLVTWVLVPVVALYLVILYLYIARIALAAELPSGEIAPMVGGCAAIAVITHYLAYPLREAGARWVRAFHRQLYRLLLAPAFVLGYAVWVRIDAYGVTEFRYTLALLAAWLIVLALHGVVRPAARIALFPALLCGAMLLGTFGPWGAVAVSERSQVRILGELLTRHGILVDGVASPATTAPNPAEAQRIGSVVSYLFDTGKQGVIAGWFATPPDSWSAALEAMGVAYVAPWQDPGTVSFWANQTAATDVAGYDFLLSFALYESGAQPLTLPYASGAVEASLGLAAGVLTATVAGASTVLDLAALAEQARTRMAPEGGAAPIPLDFTVPGFRLRLLVNNLHATTVDGRLRVMNLGGTLLVGRTVP